MPGRDRKYPAAPTDNPALERELHRYRVVGSVEFARIYSQLIARLVLDVFEEEWASEGIRSFAKEVAFRVHEGETEFEDALEEVRVYYERKRRFHEV